MEKTFKQTVIAMIAELLLTDLTVNEIKAEIADFFGKTGLRIARSYLV